MFQYPESADRGIVRAQNNLCHGGKAKAEDVAHDNPDRPAGTDNKHPLARIGALNKAHNDALLKGLKTSLDPVNLSSLPRRQDRKRCAQIVAISA